MQVFYCDHFELPLPKGHRFPIDKYRLAREFVREEIGEEVTFRVAPEPTLEQLARVHTEDYLRRVFDGRLSELEQKRIGFPWSKKMLQRSLRSTGSTLAAALIAGEQGTAVHLSGGTHHAFADQGQGFCVFNDVAVAAMELLVQPRYSRILVIDLDVHQGNGTASIFANDARVTTFSMHGDKNFPFRKTEGDLDVAMPDDTSDHQYLKTLEEVLNNKLPLSEFDFAFYIAGADPYAGDRMGRLSLSQAGLEQRDQLVLKLLFDHRIPSTVVMGGGYAGVEEVARIHCNAVHVALRQYRNFNANSPQ